MKICYIGDAASVHTHRWVKFFADAGHDVTLLSRNKKNVPGERILSPEIPLYGKLPKIVRKYFGNLVFWFFVIKKLREIEPDEIIALNLWPYGLFAVYSFHPKKVPIVMCPWGSDVLIYGKKNPIFRYFAKRIFEKSDLIQVDSREVMKTSLWIGAPRKKMMLLCIPGVDTTLFKEARRKVPHSIISTRAFKPVYDVETTLKAFAIIVEMMPEATLLLAGDGPLKSELKNLAESLKISGKIKWLGMLSHEELKKYLASSEVYISTSLSDSTPVSLLEAMATSLPAVLSDVPANMEWITNGNGGFIFKKKDYETAAKEVLDLLKNNEKRKLFGKRNRRFVVENADYNRMMKKFLEDCEKLV